MTSDLIQTFLSECSEAFAFLANQYGFNSPPILDANSSIRFTTVTFMGRNIALECVFDERENWLEFKIARVINGAKPEAYAIDHKGNIVRDNLFLMLKRRGAKDAEFKIQITPLSSVKDNFKFKLNLYASLLQKYGHQLI